MKNPEFHKSQTLFFPASASGAILVKTRNDKQTSKPMRFADAHKALSWCIANKAGFVYFLDPDPSQN